MKASAALVLFMALSGLACPAFSAHEEDRDFFDGIQARNIGPFRGGRAMAAAGVRQNPHTYYMGTTGGVWKTTNAGASWAPVSDKHFGSSAVGAIAVAPSDPNVVVVGMGESPFRNIASSQGDGVYKSADAGKSWSRIGFEDVRQIGEIRIHPGDPDVIWVAAQGNIYSPGDNTGVYKSIDGGASWRRVLEPRNNTTGAVDLSLDTNNPRVLYAALWDHQRTAWDLRSGGPGSGVWRSSDGGETWKELTEGLPEGMGKIGVAASSVLPGLVWAIVEAEDDKGGLYQSVDGGDHWKLINSKRVLRARSWYYMHIFADPVDAETVYVMNAPFLKSVDGGKSFSTVKVPHGDNHYLWINPDQPRWMINANDGGANVSFDGGASWSRQDNQPTAQFYRVNADNLFEYRVYGGQQDNSTVAIKSRSRDGSIGRDDWEIHGGCESAYVAMDPDNPRYTYAGCYLGLIQEFDTVTRTVRSIKAYEEAGLGQPASEQKLRFNWNAPLHVSMHDPSVIYHAGNHVLRSDNRGFNWSTISPDLTRNEPDKQGPGAGPYTNENIEIYNTVLALEESPHDPNTLWAGSDDGLIHITRDGGSSWDNVTPKGAGRGLINAIDVSPHDPGIAYVSVLKYKEGDNRPYVYKTVNYGRSWRRISDPLPQEHFARVVREDPDRPGLLFAGLERGLFLSFDGGENWEPFQTNLPVVPITDLMVRRNDLVFSTQGRGFWVIDDIAPLRQFSQTHRTSDIHLYEPSAAFRTTPTVGGNRGGESASPSSPSGAVIYYALSKSVDLDQSGLTLEILDSEGQVIRRLETDKKKGAKGGGSNVSYALSAEAGINRAVWDLRRGPTPEVEYPFVFGAPPAEKSIPGHRVAPGEYGLRLALEDQVVESRLSVQWDPVNDYDDVRIQEQQQMLSSIHTMIVGIYQRLNSLSALTKQLEMRRSLAEDAGKQLQVTQAETVIDALKSWQNRVSTPQRKTQQDVINFNPQLDTFLVNLYQQVDNAVLGITQGQKERFADLEPQWKRALADWDQLIEGPVQEYIDQSGPALIVPSWN